MSGADVAPAPVASSGSLRCVLTAAGIVAIALATGLAAATADQASLVAGVPAPEPVVTVMVPALTVVMDLAAAVTVGWLLAAAWLVPPQPTRVLDVGGSRAVRSAASAAVVWAMAALALIPFSIAGTLGLPLTDALSADTLLVGLQLLDAPRGLLVSAAFAGVIAVLARVVLHPGGAAWLLALAVAGLLPRAVTGHGGSARDHDIAVDSMVFHLLGLAVWVGGLVALLGLARQRTSHLPMVAARYSTLALVAFAAVAASGVLNASLRLTGPGDLWTTTYGRLVVVKAAALIVLGALGVVHRRRTLPALRDAGDSRSLRRLAVGEVLVMAATIGVAVALSRSAPPDPGRVEAPSDQLLILGFELPGPPTVGSMLTAWRFDWLLGVLAVAAVVGYLAGVRRLRRRGDRWPPGRTVAWTAGWATVLIVTSSGLGRYAEAQFSLHMIAHMLLGMVAPALLVLGGPVTLALRAIPPAGRSNPPGPREAILAALHSRTARVVTHPLVVLPLFVGSFAAVYFTALFGQLVSTHLGHLAMNVHFLVVGYLYYWLVIGIDPTPRRMPYMARFAVLMAPVPFHVFLGLALMNSRQALAPDYYTSLALPWVPDLVADQRLGGAIAWAATEGPIAIVIIALVIQWSRSDDREARRADRRAGTAGDRRADAELAAYNNMLAVLAARDATPAPRESGAGLDDLRDTDPRGADG